MYINTQKKNGPEDYSTSGGFPICISYKEEVSLKSLEIRENGEVKAIIYNDQCQSLTIRRT
jgi:hypothetical protein